ncbi:MAG: hypothetical protein R2712_12455 [Vicinamibacterales bacterium]
MTHPLPTLVACAGMTLAPCAGGLRDDACAPLFLLLALAVVMPSEARAQEASHLAGHAGVTFQCMRVTGAELNVPRAYGGVGIRF